MTTVTISSRSAHYYEFNPYIDFCFWVLELDGLKVLPFNQCCEGNGELQARGLTATSWRTWLFQVVAWQDQRLGWDDGYSEEFIVEHLAESKRHAVETNQEIDLLTIRAKLVEELAWKFQQYQQAAAEVGLSPSPILGTQIYLESPDPPQIWDEELSVGERLKELWKLYISRVFSRRHQEQCVQEEQLSPQLWSVLASYKEQLPVLHIYQVAYPQPLEYIVPPAAIILSLASGLPDSEAFCRCVSHTIEMLAAVNYPSSD